MVYLLGEARLARMALEQDGDAEANRERYRRTLSLIGTLVERLRLSWRMFDQDGADLIEIWLVNELAAVRRRIVVGSGTVRAFGSRRERRCGTQCRTAAGGGHELGCLPNPVDAPEGLLGGYAWRGEETSILFRVNPFLRRRAADYLTWRMLQRLDRSEPAESVERTKELARYWGVPELYYGLGPGGEYLRADKPADFAMPVEGFFRSAPGSQWHAGWERAARELADSLDVAKAKHRQTNTDKRS